MSCVRQHPCFPGQLCARPSQRAERLSLSLDLQRGAQRGWNHDKNSNRFQLNTQSRGGGGITAHAHGKRTPGGQSPTSSHVQHSVWTRVCSWEHHRRSASTAPRLSLGPGRTEGPRPLACTWLPGLGGPAHLDVAIVRPSVAIHALHCGRLSLHQVDSEQRLESHRVVHVRIVGGQVHPANDEQAVHLRGAERARVHAGLGRRGRDGTGSPRPTLASTRQPHRDSRGQETTWSAQPARPTYPAPGK